MKHVETQSIPGARRAMLAVMALLAWAGTAWAQQPGVGEKVAALKQSIQAGTAAMRKYEWVETTAVSLKGEQKSSKQNRCYYGADGAVQKIPIEAGENEAAKKTPHGIRGKIVEEKTDEMTEYVKSAVALVKEYVPPDPARIQAVKDAGKVSINLLSPGRQQLEFHDYLKTGDVLSVDVDPSTNRLLSLKVSTYLEKPDDAVSLEVTMATLQDGALYASEVVLNGWSKSVKVDIQNAGLVPLKAAAAAIP